MRPLPKSKPLLDYNPSSPIPKHKSTPKPTSRLYRGCLAKTDTEQSNRIVNFKINKSSGIVNFKINKK